MSERYPRIAAPLGDVTTNRLSLRRLAHDDLDDLAAIFEQREVWEFPYERAMTRDETDAYIQLQARSWDDFGLGSCAARELSGGHLVGIVGLAVPTNVAELAPVVTVGWRLAPSAWGKGYATEGAAALLDVAFTTMQLDRVCCVTHPDNVRSIRVAARLGFRSIGAVAVPPADRIGAVTAEVYEMRAGEWRTPATRYS